MPSLRGPELFWRRPIVGRSRNELGRDLLAAWGSGQLSRRTARRADLSPPVPAGPGSRIISTNRRRNERPWAPVSCVARRSGVRCPIANPRPRAGSGLLVLPWGRSLQCWLEWLISLGLGHAREGPIGSLDASLLVNLGNASRRPVGVCSRRAIHTIQKPSRSCGAFLTMPGYVCRLSNNPAQANSIWRCASLRSPFKANGICAGFAWAW